MPHPNPFGQHSFASAGGQVATNDDVQMIDVIDVDNRGDAVVANNDGDDIEINTIIKRFHDTLGSKHWVAKYPTVQNQRTLKRYTKARRCSTCGKSTCCFCYQCGIPLCYSISQGQPKHTHECFVEHVKEHVRKTTGLNMQDSELVE